MSGDRNRWPDFIVIGAAKCGTTTLAAYLGKHPGIRISEPKEPEFFALESPSGDAVARYLDLFAQAPDAALCGEASTIYSRFPYCGDVAARIAARTPAARILYIVREPVYRAFADCAMIQRFWFNTGRSKSFELDFEQALLSDDPLMRSIRDAGRYHFQLQRYMQHYPPDRIMVLLMEDLIRRPRDALDRVLGFLGLDPHVECVFEEKLALNRRSDFETQERRNLVARKLAGLPLSKQFRSLIPRRSRERLYDVMARTSLIKRGGRFTLAPMKQDTFEELKAYYEPDIAALERHMQVSLTSWREVTYEAYLRQCDS